MSHRYGSRAWPCALVVPLLLLEACSATPAPKVQCDSNLRPINSSPTDAGADLRAPLRRVP